MLIHKFKNTEICFYSAGTIDQFITFTLHCVRLVAKRPLYIIFVFALRFLQPQFTIKTNLDGQKGKRGCPVPNKFSIRSHGDAQRESSRIRSVLVDYFQSVATIQDNGIQQRLLKELIRQYVALEKQVDGLLKNTLPAEVAEEIKESGYFAPRSCHCTILFADICGFTQLAARLSGEELIGILDMVVRAADNLIHRFRGTKVKTIGDAYMAVFGTPRPDPDHPSLALQAGLAMQEQLKTFSKRGELKLESRIGVHTGTVMAGVVGEERMQFDIFGDSVNIASRFETTGAPGRVNCSHETYVLTRDRFFFEERGEIPLKHRGRMTAYFVLGERDETAATL